MVVLVPVGYSECWISDECIIGKVYVGLVNPISKFSPISERKAQYRILDIVDIKSNSDAHLWPTE